MSFTKLNKNTVNYANKRELDVTLEVDDETVELWVWHESNDMEPLFILNVSDTGYFYKGNVWLPNEIKEELPHWVKSTKELHNVLDFVSKELKNNKKFQNELN
jgi:hypothetical protein